MMRRSIPAAVILLAASLALGCAKLPPRIARDAEGDRTRAAVSLERRLRDFAAATSTIKALAFVRVDSGERKWSTESAVVVARPDRVRVDAMDALADVWASSGSDASNMWLYLPAKRRLYEGDATPRNMRRLLGFEIAPAELISIMAGSPFISESDEVLETAAHGGRHFVLPSSGLLCTQTKGSKGMWTGCFKPGGDDGEKAEYEIEFKDFRAVGGVYFPHLVEARFPDSPARIEIRYREVALGEEIDQGAFQPPRSRAARTHRYKR